MPPSSPDHIFPDGQPRDAVAHQSTRDVAKSSEAEIRDLLLQNLFHQVGDSHSWEGEGKSARFKLKPLLCHAVCAAEEKLEYNLPSWIKLKHSNDILISDINKNWWIGIEIKHRSAVTDQFKCRAYDMQHLKDSFKDRLLGIMVYVKANEGISEKRAKGICYYFDKFVYVPDRDRHLPSVWNELYDTIIEFLKRQLD